MLEICGSDPYGDFYIPFKAMLAAMPPEAPVRIAFAPSACGGDIDIDARVDHLAVSRLRGGGIEVCIYLSEEPPGEDEPRAGDVALFIAGIWYRVIPLEAMCRRVVDKLETLEGERPSIVLD